MKKTIKKKIVALLCTAVAFGTPFIFAGCDLLGDNEQNETEQIYTPDTPEFQEKFKAFKDCFENIINSNNFEIEQNLKNSFDSTIWRYSEGIIEVVDEDHKFGINDNQIHCCQDDKHKLYYTENGQTFELKQVLPGIWGKNYFNEEIEIPMIDFKIIENMFSGLKEDVLIGEDIELKFRLPNEILLKKNDCTYLFKKNINKLELPKNITDFTVQPDVDKFNQDLNKVIEKILDDRNFTVDFYNKFAKYKFLFDESKMHQIYEDGHEKFYEDSDKYIENDSEYSIIEDSYKYQPYLNYEKKDPVNIIKVLNNLKNCSFKLEDYDYVLNEFSGGSEGSKFFVTFSDLNKEISFFDEESYAEYRIYDIGKTNVELPKKYFDENTQEWVDETELG